MRSTTRLARVTRFLTAVLCSSLASATVLSEENTYPGPYIEHDDILVILIPHTPEQMSAFYEARGFPQAARDLITQTCFVTVHIENKSREIIWLDLDQWAFSSSGKPLTRLDQSYWESQWNSINLRQASRSTFGWTQFPPLRDLQPDEPVGGNIVFPGNTTQFNMALHMATGKDKRGKQLSLEFRDINCPQDEDNK